MKNLSAEGYNVSLRSFVTVYGRRYTLNRAHCGSTGQPPSDDTSASNRNTKRPPMELIAHSAYNPHSQDRMNHLPVLPRSVYQDAACFRWIVPYSLQAPSEDSIHHLISSKQLSPKIEQRHVDTFCTSRERKPGW